MEQVEILGVNGKNPTHTHIEWYYPEIYDRSNQSTITIDLCHTRAADGIRLKYDSERDGWVIEQASVFEHDVDDDISYNDWQEVAFVQAWARKKK